MSSYDRFAPESYEDFLCRGKSRRECADIRRELAEKERQADEAAAARETEETEVQS